MEYHKIIEHDHNVPVNNRQWMANQQPPQWSWDALVRAYHWIADQYDIAKGTRIPPIRGSYSCRFSKFSWGNMRYFDGAPHIRIHLKRKYWLTYRRKSIGVHADGIIMPKEIVAEIQYVHELTHWVQHIQSRDYSEVETTENEIKFVEEFYPQYIKELKPVK